MKLSIAASSLLLLLPFSKQRQQKVLCKAFTVSSSNTHHVWMKKDLPQISSRNAWLQMSVVEDVAAESSPSLAGDDNVSNEPLLSQDGIYQVENKEQHAALLAAHPCEIIILKYYAPWCRACKGLAPKFVAVAQDKKFDNLPLVYAEMSIQHNKEFVKSMGVLALPSVQIYAGSDGLVENFPCGPSKVPVLRKKMIALINERVDATTRKLKKSSPEVECVDGMEETEPCKERSEFTIGDYVVSDEQLSAMRTEIPFFKDFTDAEFDMLMSKATLQTFEPGSIIMKQGMPGHSFFVIESGEVEIGTRTGFEDPLTTPSTYLGAVMNTLSTNQYFGERSLVTGEPRAASIRATEKTRCFRFRQEDIPTSSVLSGKMEPTQERLEEVNEKYGVDATTDTLLDVMDQQLSSANIANQKRGSTNTPELIRGVDTDDDITDVASRPPVPSTHLPKEDIIFPLLIRFKRVRHAARCINYISKTTMRIGDPSETNRRTILVSKLPKATYDEFADVYNFIDTDNSGTLDLLEMKQFMETVNQRKSEDEWKNIFSKFVNSPDGNVEITFDDFMGVMAEAEFYYLFTDTFNALDKFDSGFVRAGDLDHVLGGMRDLISDDRASIIDVEDKDILVDYEQFSRMLLGASL